MDTTTTNSGFATDQPVILVPLYIYPLQEAWEPLFDLARALPNVSFVTVINPCNGPGPDALPDASYCEVLQRLNAIPNVHSLGYVHCTYGTRSVDAIRADIDIYLGWNDTFQIDGIFFDETPSDPSSGLEFMNTVSNHTRSTWQRSLDRPGRVCLNPGVVVDRAFFDAADWVVVFEQSQEHWQTFDIQQAMQVVPFDLRKKCVAIVHSLEDNDVDAADLTTEICAHGFGGIHLTEELGGGYTKWPAMWATVAQVVAKDASA
ncbi:Spherulation-specific family 4 [Dactylonectria estremocensis]|uniref:Spherulation-specific family 4 n=1 Tax=Dactylonectria estremocensis TaxID=1079267 RepID=A0A9P9FD39_9HYPO|nr:Spherulation-specific family 4 [Dactylonectria estremocensis]